MKGTMFMFGELCLIYKACEIASEFEIEISSLEYALQLEGR
jgi:hypothetical protein